MIAEPYSSEAPKTSGAQGEMIVRRAGSGFALPCRVQGFPVPEFRYSTVWVVTGVSWETFIIGGQGNPSREAFWKKYYIGGYFYDEESRYERFVSWQNVC